MQTVRLTPLVACSDAEKLRIRDIRNQPSIRQAMYTDHEITVEEHRAWLARLETDATQIVFAVLVDDELAGAASVSALDRRHKRCDWAFYLHEDQRGGLGKALEFAFIDYVFDTLKLEKLNCEVIESNRAVVRMHQKFGFVEEGFRRSNIVKNGERIGVHFLGLTRADWKAARSGVETTYAPVLRRFAITIDP